MRRPVGVKRVLLFFRWARLFSLCRVATVATLPSALYDERFSLGASWVFSFQPVLPPDFRPPVPFLTELLHVGYRTAKLLSARPWRRPGQSVQPSRSIFTSTCSQKATPSCAIVSKN